MADKYDYKKFKEFLNSIPIEELHRKNDEELDKTAREFEEFSDALSHGNCSFCKHPITHFSERNPCFHWLLKPKGFKTRHFPLLYKQKSYHQINLYLRWVANSTTPLRSINDLTKDRSPSKIIEETIRYKNLEWSFSCSEQCMCGETHKGKNTKPLSHYHFQMRIDGKVIISYGQFHIPFSDYDHFCFAVARGEFDKLKGGHIEGAGMQALYEQFSPEELLDLMVATEKNEDEALFRTQTLVVANKGTTISGNDIVDILKEHKKTKIPIAKLIHRLKNITATSYITPGPGVPEIAARKSNRGKKKH